MTKKSFFSFLCLFGTHFLGALKITDQDGWQDGWQQEGKKTYVTTKTRDIVNLHHHQLGTNSGLGSCMTEQRPCTKKEGWGGPAETPCKQHLYDAST